MHPTLTDKSELISICRQFYRGNEFELGLIDEFEKSYSTDRALWWYTKESFVYRLMNKAMRTLSIDLLFAFHFFIRDLEQQLEQRKCTSPLRVYRCQLMSKEEVQILQKAIGQFIAMNSYFSTSTDRRAAMAFLHYASDLEQVLFEIDADPGLKGIKPFANITAHSYFPDEEEVLFPMGSIFQLSSVEQDEDELWTIRIVLASNVQHSSQLVIDQIKSDQAEEVTTFLTYGDVVQYMGMFDKAEKYYRRSLEQSSGNEQHHMDCYYSLGNVAAAKGNYSSSLQWHLDSLAMKQETLKSTDPKIARSYGGIAAVHAKQGNHRQALESYEKALKIWKKAYGGDHPKVSQCVTDMGTVYEQQGNTSEALACYQKALEIEQTHFPVNYHHLSEIHDKLGHVYCLLEEYDAALNHYHGSLQSKSKILPNSHPSIAVVYRKIGMVHEKTGCEETAQSFYDRADDIERKTWLVLCLLSIGNKKERTKISAPELKFISGECQWIIVESVLSSDPPSDLVE